MNVPTLLLNQLFKGTWSRQYPYREPMLLANFEWSHRKSLYLLRTQQVPCTTNTTTARTLYVFRHLLDYAQIMSPCLAVYG
uniref:Tick transposon n=1 Tax=Rhipicephalus appendiculatus TaxID=34631 RepID=A0A131YPV5_RHIAP